MGSIVVDNVTKSYRIGVGRARVREMVPPPIDRACMKVAPRWWKKDTFNALEGVSLEVPAGSAVGIVGPNGAGKTTLLKVIAGVTSPASGHVRVTGRLAALIDALVGFHTELTGRENAYLLGAIHGFRRRDIASRIDRIFGFAEIDDLADTPLKRYSAGMVARLGFATITALDVDILLVDEVLAVGDARFQGKCIEWLDDYRTSGGTLVFVSHNLGLVRHMTERVVWIDHGRVAQDGPTGKVLATYARAQERRHDEPLARQGEARKLMLSRGLHRWGAGGARVEEVRVQEPTDAGRTLEIDITYRASDVEHALFCVGFLDESGREIGAACSPPMKIGGNGGAVRCVIEPLPFRAGIYFPVVAILSPDGLIRDHWRLDRAVVVEGRTGVDSVDAFGPIDIPADWAGCEVDR